MTSAQYEIRDLCRKSLCRYTLQAFSFLTLPGDPSILDLGCGTGVSTLTLMQNCKGTFCAVDVDRGCLERLKARAELAGLLGRIRIIHASEFEAVRPEPKFDVVLAEGLLNMTGFEKGLGMMLSSVKAGGYLVIHDELRDEDGKRRLFEERGLGLLGRIELSPEVWRKEYYACLEKAVRERRDEDPFEQELREIRDIKENPGQFQSVFYILKSPANLSGGLS